MLGIVAIIVLSLGTAKSADAACKTARIDCGDGQGHYGLVCGETTQEMVDNADEMGDVICGR
ncbi:MAG: hypothetical protein JEZ09_18615 [Salinivirgaceae bacterium]|nr:hypothetical protein [Salinivirgaceae bacterium]